MSQVTLVNLNADATAVETGSIGLDFDHDAKERLQALLENFESLKPSPRGPEPEMRIGNGVRDYAVQNVNGVLYVKSIEDLNQQNVKVSPEDVVTVFDGGVLGLVDPGRQIQQEREFDEIEAKAEAEGRSITKRSPKYAGAVVMILVSVLAVAVSATLTFLEEEEAAESYYRPVTQSGSVSEYRLSHAGRYITGEGLGERAITLSMDGTVTISQAVPADNAQGWRWRNLTMGQGEIGHTHGMLGVRTWEGGWIEIPRQGVLTFYDETYLKVHD